MIMRLGVHPMYGWLPVCMGISLLQVHMDAIIVILQHAIRCIACGQ